MNEVTLADVRAFHAELLATARTGLPVAVVGPGETLEEQLEQTTLRLERIMAVGQSLPSALDADLQLSDGYRAALKTWLFCDRSPVALESLTKPAEVRRRVRRQRSVLLLHPLILLTLAYFALILLSWQTLLLESLYRQLELEPAPFLRMTLWIREWLPVWAPLLPVGLLLCVVWYGWGHSLRRHRSDQTLAPLRLGNSLSQLGYAERLAEFLGQGIPVEQATRMAGPQVLQPAGQLPPLLQWATQVGEVSSPPAVDAEAQSPLSAVQFVARLYARVTDFRIAEYRRGWYPAAIVCVSGLTVLAVALCVFLPVVEFLAVLAGEV